MVTFDCYMKWFFVLALVGIAVTALPGSSQTHSSSSTATKKAKKTTHSTNLVPVSNSKTRKNTRGHGRAKHGPPPPSYQLHPDPERYQQIQQALADRGYFKGQANGEWGDDSVDALKRFQADQKLDPDGKINALSLIGLGLGPKHDGSSAPAGVTSTPPLPPPPDINTAPPR